MEHELTWGLPVILYLFLAGLGAGASVVSGSVLLRSGDTSGGFFRLARYGAFIGPFPALIGCGLLVFELGRWDRALNLFKVINLSPMSIGSWFLLLYIFAGLAYACTFLPSIWPRFGRLHARMLPAMHVLAWINVPLGIGVAVYTGILLGAMPARPLWNSPILALLFLISALSTGVAATMLARALCRRGPADADSDRQYHDSAYMLTTADLVLIGLEIMVIFLFVMFAHLTIGNLKYAIGVLLPGGALAASFWFWVVLVGLLLPGLAELAYAVPRMIYRAQFRVPRVPEVLISVAVLIGGLMLRYIIVVGGQVTGPAGI